MFTLDTSLASYGFHRDDITDVFLTHFILIIVEVLFNGIKIKQVMNLLLETLPTGVMKNTGIGQQNQIIEKKLRF